MRKKIFLFIFHVLKGKESNALHNVGFSTGKNEITQENMEKIVRISANIST